MQLYWSVLVLLLLAFNGRCARILGIFNTPSISHQSVFQPIWRELSLRGHRVVIVTPNPLNDPTLLNLTELSLASMYEHLEDIKQELSTGRDHWKMINSITPYLIDNTEQTFSHNKVKSLIEGNDTFDVVLVEPLFPTPAIFAFKYKCPIVGIASVTVTNHIYEKLGSPTHPTVFPDLVTNYDENMPFLDRVDAVLFDLWYRYKFSYEILPALDKVIKKFFGHEAPSLLELEKSISLVLLNNNPILHKPRLYGPNIIEMGGMMHIKPRRALPADLKQFLDNSTEGVVYLSFGSNVKSKYLPEDKKRILVEVLSELPYKVLWKFEDDELEGRPENVKISKWLPQQDLLGHPNIKLFITQGGLQSLEEAVVRQTPLLAIPFMADQFQNALRIKKLGIGLNLNFQSLDKVSFKSAILEVANNSSYKENIVKLSALLQDEPITGLEKAVWWIEYVIRNKGATHLRSPIVDVSWCEFLLIDVYLFLLSTLLVILYITFKIIILIWKSIQKLKKFKKE